MGCIFKPGFCPSLLPSQLCQECIWNLLGSGPSVAFIFCFKPVLIDICIAAVLRSEKGAVAKTGPGVGKAAIGGPFKLLNQEGKVVTDRDFVGNWSLFYFGFTYCPDICPDELTKIAEVVDKIGGSPHIMLSSILCVYSLVYNDADG